MADFIQSQVKLLHEFAETKPTQATDQNDNANPTSPKTPKKGAQGIQKRLGKRALQRRMVNYAIRTIEQGIEQVWQQRFFESQLKGDRRQLAKDQQSLARIKGVSNTIRQGFSAGITAYALKTPAIAYLAIANHAVSAMQNLSQQQQLLSQYNILKDKEMFESTKRLERVRVGTYNRRG